MNNREKTGELLLFLFYNMVSVDYGYAFEHSQLLHHLQSWFAAPKGFLFCFFTILEILTLSFRLSCVSVCLLLYLSCLLLYLFASTKIIPSNTSDGNVDLSLSSSCQPLKQNLLFYFT